ncbi:DUF86 domain-containing protein [Pontibacillus litoralis]|uniref:DUF86 domain-containing protein n=1 Tax=Pontibacillus litoralis JSM 072002 TaxID=1385512 RepID=A0A0A5G0R0_9BACI|nr:DUF86 domain-containing protein [Pontibacillus litoralis]KGX86701.1 hypothetical protein N784_03640 [Pontibacillus litoralis JSM 072002]
MYFVERSKIESTLQYMDQLVHMLQEETYDTSVQRLALERIVQMSIESIIDVGNMMIDGFIMRDPGSYEDIIDILIDEQVIPSEEEVAYKEIIALRKSLVREYTTINHRNMLEIMKKNAKILAQFSTYIRRYLHNELGPVSAFTNDSAQ